MKEASLAQKKSSNLRVHTARRMNRIELHQRKKKKKKKKGRGTQMTNA
jgi:hypothetical protein